MNLAWLPGAILGVVSLIVTVAIFLSNRKQTRDQIATKDFDSVKTDVGNMKIAIAEINVKLQIFWKDVSFDAARILHQPHAHAAEMDRLLDKYLAEQLRGNELKLLIVLLEATRDDDGQIEGRRLAASQMLRAIKQRFELIDVRAVVGRQIAEATEPGN